MIYFIFLYSIKFKLIPKIIPIDLNHPYTLTLKSSLENLSSYSISFDSSFKDVSINSASTVIKLSSDISSILSTFSSSIIVAYLLSLNGIFKL
ncbi:hypothetical protein A0H76_1071 [Hepatospora eriocheir]|uniref:Uncharacterized protein n=1 Tax=Hepatospora eriocheir TaxID=1081669 RepID=A0A1X0QKV2_9MICR|nr:hypothetical protein A0H76_1071 [Hepatospora eriocheir]